MPQFVEFFYGLFRSSSDPKSKLAESPSDPKSKLHEFSRDPEKQKYATELSHKFLPPIYHNMCYAEVLPNEMEKDRKDRFYYCKQLRKLFTDAMVGIKPIEFYITQNMDGLAKMCAYPSLDLSDEQKNIQ